VGFKMLLFFGVLGLITTLGGYTCQAVNGKVANKDSQIEIENQIAVAKSQLKQEMEKEFAEKQSAQTSTYMENGADLPVFTISYPSAWKVLRYNKAVYFIGADDNQYSAPGFTVQLISPVKNDPDPAQTSTWNGLPIKIYNQADSTTGERKKIDLFPKGFGKSRYIIEFSGTPDDFDRIFQSIKDFKI